jgi:predicted ferric reductase
MARAGLILVYVVALFVPAYEFFSNRGGLDVLQGLTAQSTLQVIFPLVGLYAFTFVTFQVLIATNLYWLKNIWPRIINFHHFQGTFALLFALLHPFFILIGFGLSTYIHYRFVPSGKWPLLIPAYTALAIMVCTVTTALLAWHGRNVPFWRRLHVLNYFVFPLVWVHSWFIGSDTALSFLRTMWLVYLLLITASITGKFWHTRTKTV